MLLWLITFSVRLGRMMFRDIQQKRKENDTGGARRTEAALTVLASREDGMLGKRFVFSDTVSIGRDSDNDIVIPEQFVSHHHALVYKHSGRFVIKDLGSRNHSYVNDRMLTGSAFLESGDVIRIGMVTLQFKR